MNAPRLVTPAELRSLLRESAAPPVVIDVRLDEDFQEEHIEEAIGNCVFEVAFLERMELPKTVRICVYGASAESHESRMAAEKLARAGFADVLELREGIEGWKRAGFATVAGETVAVRPGTQPTDGAVSIDLRESRVEWTGRNLLSKHWGTVALKSGHLRFENGVPAEGEFVLDMTAMECTDLAGSPLHDVLVHHLQSDDFFDVEIYPEAVFSIRSAEILAGATAGMPNVRLHGTLTLKGVSRPLSIDAAAGLTTDGRPAAQASFAIDRTEWNVLYGSGRFFRRLAGHLVNDQIDLQLRIVGVLPTA